MLGFETETQKIEHTYLKGCCTGQNGVSAGSSDVKELVDIEGTLRLKRSQSYTGTLGRKNMKPHEMKRRMSAPPKTVMDTGTTSM